ncbi:threonine synthase [Sphingomonas sp. 10B4]|uniref:threonine synthase n=1 Tax=Sphingomonas sp. 10B4 TaxID=3048575 RepID=UPI002AB49C6F|nr:threonine synthase [Sphingomonas sp. 10B4]MDY7524819.1 threonine synthase [Sphingomonas sp. 10B4]MEB0281194.1 threonine synthase [Sphingomonas sp. 10B4]
MNSNLTADRSTFVTHLECSMTGERYEADQLHGLSRVGRPLLVRYDLDAIKAALPKATLEARQTDLWRWRELLPVRRTENIVSLGEIETPLVPIPKSAGSANVLVKDEGRLPTGSFKARGLVMAVAMAKELGVTRIAMPTNGNAGAALAAYATRCGIETIVLAPEETPEVNIREIAAQGARVYRVNGQIDDCGAIVGRGAAEGRWFDFSTLKEPYRIEGKKTMGLELAAQFGWKLPDAIFYPTGGGTGLIGMWKAFDELEKLGWIGSERPRMYAIQASGCAPIVRAFEAGEEHAERWEDAATVAAGIRVPKAVGDFLILRAVRESGGKALGVGDPAILKAVEDCAKKDGLLLCPEGGATLAAYRAALRSGEVDEDERVVLFNCATGLKYPMPEANAAVDRFGEIDLGAL